VRFVGGKVSPKGIKTGRAKFDLRDLRDESMNEISNRSYHALARVFARYSNSRIHAILGAIVRVSPRSIERTLASGTSASSECIFVSFNSKHAESLPLTR
jgi:hypothetical protein